MQNLFVIRFRRMSITNKLAKCWPEDVPAARHHDKSTILHKDLRAIVLLNALSLQTWTL